MLLCIIFFLCLHLVFVLTGVNEYNKPATSDLRIIFEIVGGNSAFYKIFNSDGLEFSPKAS